MVVAVSDIPRDPQDARMTSAAHVVRRVRLVISHVKPHAMAYGYGTGSPNNEIFMFFSGTAWSGTVLLQRPSLAPDHVVGREKHPFRLGPGATTSSDFLHQQVPQSRTLRLPASAGKGYRHHHEHRWFYYHVHQPCPHGLALPRCSSWGLHPPVVLRLSRQVLPTTVC